MTLEFLLRTHVRTGNAEALEHGAAIPTEKMARGGMYDQLGGGFHRYSPMLSGWCRTSRRCFMTMPYCRDFTYIIFKSAMIR